MSLPTSFIDDMKQVLPTTELEPFLTSLTEGEQPTSIRINVSKVGTASLFECPTTPVSWCPTGLYLSSRPQFTLDPMLHAGAYYVQEASSQFITHVIRHILSLDSSEALRSGSGLVLDLCASPGGKSTAALSALPQGTVLVSNEIDRKRARILAENIQKWGNPRVCVTGNAPADFRSMTEIFDLVITDVPCSGEGMFRKDQGSIAEWNPSKVQECAALQKQIVTDIWPCLKAGGYLIYSTCTFNVHEDEENLQFIHDSLGGEIIPIPIEKDWNIHPALTGSFAPDITPESACRFMPHYTQGEGLFMALIRKPQSQIGDTRTNTKVRDSKGSSGKADKALLPYLDWVSEPSVLKTMSDGTLTAIPQSMESIYDLLVKNKLYLLSAGVELGICKGKDLQPAHALALSTALRRGVFPEADLDLDTTLNYLRREAIVLGPEVPRGYVLLTYQQHPIGFVKNIGNRCNSLYPTEWRIRNL